MEDSRSSSLFNRPGAGVWVAIVSLTLSGIVWLLQLAGKVETQQVQITALQATVSARTQVLNLVEGMQKDVSRLETRQEQIREELEGFRSQREDYREIIGRQGEHMEATDHRLGRVDDRLLQVERMLGRFERGPGSGPDER